MPVAGYLPVPKEYVQSTHEHSIKDYNQSSTSDLPNATVNLTITSLPTEIQDQIHLSQQPNQYMQNIELTLFPCPTTSTGQEDGDDQDDKVEEDNADLRYYQAGLKYLVLIDGHLINLCTNVTV